MLNLSGRLIRLESRAGEIWDARSIDESLNARTRSHRRHNNAISSFELLDSRRGTMRDDPLMRCANCAWARIKLGRSSIIFHIGWDRIVNSSSARRKNRKINYPMKICRVWRIFSLPLSSFSFFLSRLRRLYLETRYVRKYLKDTPTYGWAEGRKRKDGMENGIRAVDRSSRSRPETQCQQWYDVDCDMQMEDRSKGGDTRLPNEYLLEPEDTVVRLYVEYYLRLNV